MQYVYAFVHGPFSFIYAYYNSHNYQCTATEQTHYLRTYSRITRIRSGTIYRHKHASRNENYQKEQYTVKPNLG